MYIYIYINYLLKIWEHKVDSRTEAAECTTMKAQLIILLLEHLYIFVNMLDI